MAKQISYKNMTPEQKKMAEAWADKWNQPVEECPMTILGIISNMEDIVDDIGQEAYNIVALGYVDDVDDITEKIRKQYRQDIAECKKLPKARFLK
jgi:hypothetical protein